MESSKRDAGRESAQSYAMRVWAGQSPDLKRSERIGRVESALLGQGYSSAGVEYPPTTEPVAVTRAPARGSGEDGAHQASILVKMSHHYLSLEYLAEAMGRAAINARKLTDAPAADATYALAEAVHEWHDTLYRLCKDCVIPGHHRGTLKAEEWRHLDLDQDLLWVTDLNACAALTAQGMRFQVVPDEEQMRADWQFREEAYNGRPIDWGFWIDGMPELSAEQAACLIVGLDPVVFKTLDEKPDVLADASRLVAEVRKIILRAHAEKKVSGEPDEWLWWAADWSWFVHPGFRRAAEAKCVHKTQAALDAMPAPEAAAWSTAMEVGDGVRQLVTEQPHGHTKFNQTCAQFVRATSLRLDRWRRGEYLLLEAAQVLAAKIGKPWLEQLRLMEAAVGGSESSLRLQAHGIKLSDALMPKGPYFDQVFLREDINHWLKSVGASYTLEYPYADSCAAHDGPAPRLEPGGAGRRHALTTPQLADLFGKERDTSVVGVKWTITEWKGQLKDPPQWLARHLVTRGARPKPSTWDALGIAQALATEFKPSAIAACFRAAAAVPAIAPIARAFEAWADEKAKGEEFGA